MTRKEELRKRSDLLSRRVAGGHGSKPIILEALEQVEREVWEKTAKHLEEEALFYNCEGWKAKGALKECAQWCREQQKELG